LFNRTYSYLEVWLVDSQAQLNLGFHQVSWTTDHYQSDHLDLTHDEKQFVALRGEGSSLILTQQLDMQV